MSAAPVVRSVRRGGLLLVLACVIVLVWTAVASAAPASVVYSGSKERKQIALTFDDNTITSRALAVLRALQKNDVRATLFVIGSSVNALPSVNQEIVMGMAAGYFEVGDHSRSHPQVPKLSRAGMAAEIGGGTDAFRKATGGRTVPLFRPPYGATNSTVAAVAGERGFRHIVLWSIDPRDWEGRSAQNIADHVLGRAHNGAIVVLHLSGAHTAEAVPLMAKGLRAKGYELVTVSEMLKGDRLFIDVAENTDQGAAIARMVGLGFLSGYDGNYFGPDDTITRAQVAKVAALVGGIHTSEIEGVAAPVFKDVPLQRDKNGAPIPYPFDFVQEAAAAGLVEGSKDPSGQAVFRPYETITRVQFARIVARMVRELKGYEAIVAAEAAPLWVPPGGDETDVGAMPVMAPATTVSPAALRFTDVPAEAVADVALVTSLGLMSGTSWTTFSPWEGAKRGHVAVVMSRYLDLPTKR
jgi:peptidoglycan/xylan/chitin deacetylase (PgdA/CDA1 family)